ncbi:MAG: 6,7-dimethyl-8-ribityllumazine synthase [Gemmatimonadetes bacterium]|nr:6,7-dimethyl-8-ribityllumazine synthase [Gemmatimonadota bacterium]
MLVAVSRYNEAVTRKLLDGARSALSNEGVPDQNVTVVWVPGAFELPLAVRVGLATGKYDVAVALGAVIRGETNHFEYVAGEAARGLSAAASDLGLPVGFGVLTCDTLEQALDRAGGKAGNKGSEAALSALATADALDGMRQVAED